MAVFCVVRKFTDFSDVLDDGGSRDLWNVSKLLPDDTAKNPKDSHLYDRNLEE